MFSNRIASGAKGYSSEPRKPVDHRTQVGAERSKKTRARLIEAALRVFANHGLDARMIDLVIREAGVARGTFYNHFHTTEELFHEVAREVSIEIIRIVEPLVEQQQDPAARVACGVSSVMKLAISYPILAQFVVRGGPAAVSAGSLASEIVPADIDAGIASGRFSISDRKLGLDLVVGPVIMAFHTILTEKVSDSYPNLLAQAILQSLGVSKALAKKYAFQEFGNVEMPKDSILAKTSA